MYLLGFILVNIPNIIYIVIVCKWIRGGGLDTFKRPNCLLHKKIKSFAIYLEALLACNRC